MIPSQWAKKKAEPKAEEPVAEASEPVEGEEVLVEEAPKPKKKTAKKK